MTSVRCILLAIVMCAAPLRIAAEPVRCPQADLVVEAGMPGLASAICDAAGRLSARLAQCGVVPPPALTVKVSGDMPAHCAGLYDRDTGIIRIRPPGEASAMLSDESPFAELAPEAYFESLIAHELTHAAFFARPRTCGTCRATTEYAAHVMQLIAIGEADRGAVIARLRPTRWGDRDSINVMVLALSPDLFLSRAWTHASKTGDPCGAVRRVMSGGAVFPEGLH